MKLLYFPTSHWSRAVHLALIELGLTVQREIIDITKNATFEPAYLQLNPRGVVPTLVDGSAVLWDSRTIVRHLDGRIGGGSLWLGCSPEVQRWIERLHSFPLMLLSYSVWVLGARGEKSTDILADKVERAKRYAKLYPSLRDRYLRKASFFEGFSAEVYNPSHVAEQSRACGELLDALAVWLENRTWIGGDTFCFADCIAASVLSRLCDLERLDHWYAQPEGVLRTYFERLRRRESYQFVFYDDPLIPERLRLRLREPST